VSHRGHAARGGGFHPWIVLSQEESLLFAAPREGAKVDEYVTPAVTTLTALYRTEQLGYHLRLALANGLSQDELVEAITHIAFYAGWPNAMTAITQLKNIVEETGGQDA
jgi:4-carboxymuconolactone decarboxylase